MDFNIKEIKKGDERKVIQFAISGMHFDWYLDNKTLLHLYGKYFWYSALQRATQVIAIYAEDELAGVLLADMNGERKCDRSIGKLLYVKIFELLQNIFSKSGATLYGDVNKEMFMEYIKNHSPDGEIIFLAANPDINNKGIGSRLLNELEQRENGKEIYLYTDNACTYQFYDHRGFERSCEKDVELVFGAKKVPLKCFLYRKKLLV